MPIFSFKNRRIPKNMGTKDIPKIKVSISDGRYFFRFSFWNTAFICDIPFFVNTRIHRGSNNASASEPPIAGYHAIEIMDVTIYAIRDL